MATWDKLNESSGQGKVDGTLAGMSVPPLCNRHTNPKAVSTWNTGTMAPKQATLSKAGILAVEAYIAQKNLLPVRHCALLKISQTEYSAEYKHPDTNSVDVVYYNKTNGLLYASRKTATGAFDAMNSIGKNSSELVDSILFAMIPVIADENAEFSDDLQVLTAWYPTCKQANGVVKFTDEAEYALRRICDAFYYGIKEKKVPVSTIDAKGVIPTLDPQKLAANSYDGLVLLGTPQILGEKVDDSQDNTSYITFEKAKKLTEEEREASIARLTAAQKEELLDFPDDTPVSQWVVDLALAIIATKKEKIRFCNFRIEGITNSGKTFGTMQLCALLGRPYKKQNFNPDVDKLDTKDQIVPNTESDQGSGGFAIRRPDFEDLLLDPVSFYRDITGITKLDVTPNECQEAYDAAQKNTSQFRHILSPIMAGLQGPYVIEIAEMSRARAGVLSGLNEIFDRGGTINLESAGGQFRRHPDSIVVSTDNYDYPGCKPLSPDVRRRFDKIVRISKLDDAAAIGMAAQQTGFSDMPTLKRMWSIIKDVAQFCKESHIRDGDIGLAELIAWAMSVKIGEKRYESFIECVVTKATGNDETQALVEKHLVGSQAVGRFFDEG